MRNDLTVLAVCGWSGSGKTTLIEGLLDRLRPRSLRIAVLKHDVHRLDVDRPGKDSDRFHRAGADVFMHGREERFHRIRPSGGGIEEALPSLARRYDLVLVEGFKHTPLPKIWLLSDGEERPPDDVGDLLAALPRDADRLSWTHSFLETWLPAQWGKTPVWGCVLIGGRSRRMGRPKHLIQEGGRTWIERTVGSIAEVCPRVAIAGAGEVPSVLGGCPRLPDAPDAEGPLSGILAAMRWAPDVSWLVAACDLPDLSPDALRWLLAERAPGVWAVLPRLDGGGEVEPLLAYYDVRSRTLMEDLAARGEFRPASAARSARVVTPVPPPGLAPSWRNVNSPADLGVRPRALRPVGAS